MDSLELYRNGVLTEKTVADYDQKTVQVWRLDNQTMILVEERAMTAAELADVSGTESEKTVYDKVRSALKSNNTFLGLASPTNAQAVAQLRVLTKQMNAIVKLQIREFQT